MLVTVVVPNGTHTFLDDRTCGSEDGMLPPLSSEEAIVSGKEKQFPTRGVQVLFEDWAEADVCSGAWFQLAGYGICGVRRCLIARYGVLLQQISKLPIKST